ncbi:MAG TPA: TRAP transporter small permease [Saprospiraceae bacterium]|nr:TRAP transporter small permease [Saprospiraceae bacterium]HMQ81430.1 TRAP transporter small permease [Saprospiraceae bacterium]
MKRMTKFRLQLDIWLSHFLVLLLSTMTINVVWQVVSRYLIRVPSSFTDELARYLLIWLGLFGAAYASGQGNHLSIDLLAQHLNEKQKLWINKLIYGFIILFASFTMVIGGIRLVYTTIVLKQSSAALDLPLGIVYLALPLSGFLVILYKIMDILQASDPSRNKLFVESSKNIS